MARAIDLSREQVSRLESGINRPQPGTIRQISEVFGLPVERLTVEAIAEEKVDDLLTIATLYQQSQKARGGSPPGLGQFQQFVVWFRSMSVNDQSLTLAALQKIHEDAMKVKKVRGTS